MIQETPHPARIMDEDFDIRPSRQGLLIATRDVHRVSTRTIVPVQADDMVCVEIMIDGVPVQRSMIEPEDWAQFAALSAFRGERRIFLAVREVGHNLEGALALQLRPGELELEDRGAEGWDRAGNADMELLVIRRTTLAAEGVLGSTLSDKAICLFADLMTGIPDPVHDAIDRLLDSLD
jgi:hypothetical protein